MTASAIARHFQEREPLDYSPVKSLTYSQADLDFAKRLIAPQLGTIADRLARESDMAVRQRTSPAISTYITFLRTLHDKVPLTVSRKAFYLYCSNIRNISSKTFSNYLTSLKDGNIVRIGHGSDEMHNDPDWLLNNGFIKTREDILAEKEELRAELWTEEDGIDEEMEMLQ